MLLLLLLGIFTGCKKDYTKYPFKEIISFNIKDANGELLKAQVTNGEIVINWPVQQVVPESVSPQIIVGERANISPASGTPVKLENGTIYTVTAEDGSTTTYKIKLLQKNIPPFISFTNLRNGNSKYFALKGAGLTITGDYFNPDIEKTKVFFIDANNVETRATVTRVTQITISTNVPTVVGTYKLKVVSNTDTIFYTQAFDVLETFVQPSLPFNALATPLVLRRGDTFTVTGGTLLNGVNRAVIGSFTPGIGVVDLIVTQATANSIVLKVSDTTPLGVYAQFIYYFVPGGYYNANGFSINSNITIVQ